MSTAKVTEVKTIEGKVWIRLEGMPAGVWKTYDSPIDSLIAHVQRELAISSKMNGMASGVVLSAISVDPASISRCRARQGGYSAIPEHWLLRLHEFSGIPVSELRYVSGTESEIIPHHKARHQPKESS